MGFWWLGRRGGVKVEKPCPFLCPFPKNPKLSFQKISISELSDCWVTLWKVKDRVTFVTSCCQCIVHRCTTSQCISTIMNRWTTALGISCEYNVWNGQVLPIISAPIFNENLPNFREWCKNIQKLLICQMFRKQIFKIATKKNVGGVC